MTIIKLAVVDLNIQIEYKNDPKTNTIVYYYNILTSIGKVTIVIYKHFLLFSNNA